MSLRASTTSELILDSVRLPADAMLPRAKGLSGPMRCLNEARYGIVWGAMGAARDCLESVLTYEGTSEVHQLAIGQALTGISASRTDV